MKQPQGNPFIHSFTSHKDSSILTLISLYKGKYHDLIGSAIFFVIKHSPTWVLPIATANIINAATTPGPDSVHSILLNTGIMILLILQNVPTNFIHTKLYSKSIRYVEAGLRETLIRKLQMLSITYHREMQSGRLQSKIMRDVEAVETLSNQLFLNMLTILLNITVALTITISKSMVVFIFFLCTIPVAAIIIASFRRRVRSRNNEFRKEMEDTSAKVMEMVELIPVTKAHGLEEFEISRITGQLTKVATRGYHLDIIQSFFGSISWSTFQIFQIVCLAFTGYLAYKGRILVGDVVMYQSYFTSIVAQVSGIIGLLPIIAKGLESITSIGDVILKDDVEGYSGKERLNTLLGTYQFSHVSFHYKDSNIQVLSDFNLTVSAGETIALVGESGAGKTTILNLVIGFIKPTSGQITLDGKDLNSIDLRHLRQQIAVVPQTSILFTGTIRENITYGLENVTEEAMKEAVVAANLSDLIDSLPDGLNTKITEHGNNLSGGQRQRISIARAIIRNPKIIILDEATSALDSFSEKKIQAALNNLIKDRTTFIVAHRLSTIKDADRIAVIDQGHCVELGSYDELMAVKGEFYRMRKLQ
ncbi:MAG: ABC transporter ATP-binding protein [bacterium]|nr:ABC transporter ATP-binding protein [bacterium]